MKNDGRGHSPPIIFMQEGRSIMELSEIKSFLEESEGKIASFRRSL